MYNNRSIVLCVLDGWGIGKDDRYNAIKKAKTPTFDFLSKNFPSSRLRADGRHVGLLPGQMGNLLNAFRDVPLLGYSEHTIQDLGAIHLKDILFRYNINNSNCE